MAGRALRASAEGIERARTACKRDGWTQEELRVELGLKTRQPITRFLAGQPIERHTFIDLCRLLGLEEKEIVEPESVAKKQDSEVDIDALVKEIREKVKPNIRERCGMMRVLDMNHPIELTGEQGIYINVNILEKITGRRRLEISELLKNRKLKDFDRVELNQVSEERVPGLEVVKRYSKLMVLGKPGAGKTTFLKYLAMQCIEGHFQINRVPIFISLKDLPRKNICLLAQYIIELFSEWSLDVEIAQIGELFKQGRVLVLLDGLDEVRERESSSIINLIREFCDNYPNNYFVITCRLAATEYIFEQFTDVEVADFDIKQIAMFAEKWFQLSSSVKADHFIKKLHENLSIQELASNPLLLTLLCLVFEDKEGLELPKNRYKLYEEGLEVLLKKWDLNRGIERDQVYKNLSVKRKEELLGQIALTTFKQKDYFFDQEMVEAYISNFICALPDVNPDLQMLRLNSEAILKSIEVQHGLLVERAKNIYSFSHLTFQEYLSARRIVTNSSLDDLVEYITDKHWREIFILAAGMMPKADDLMLLMKQEIDDLIASDEKLQQFLSWLRPNSDFTEFSSQPSAVYSFCHGLDKTYDFVHELNNNLIHARDHALELTFALVKHLDSVNEFASCINDVLVHDLGRTNDHILAGDLYRTLMLTRKYAHNLAIEPELQLKLQQLQDVLPDTSYENWENFKQLWQSISRYWIFSLRTRVNASKSDSDLW